MRLVLGDRRVTVASLHLNWRYPFDQAGEIGRLARPFRQLPRPLVVAGDLNASSWTNAVARITRLSDTGVAPGLRRS